MVKKTMGIDKLSDAIIKKAAVQANKDQQKVVDMYETVLSYTVSGVPASSIGLLMKELNLNESKFYDFMAGQIVGVIGGEALYYVCDIHRFIKNLSVID
jgi:hypothetical protein